VGAGATTELTVDVRLDPFRPWSPESPLLYKAELVLKQAGSPIDGWIERFGMKKYEVRGGDLYLNNVRYFLRVAATITRIRPPSVRPRREQSTPGICGS